MRVLVTGGAGFLGAHVVDLLFEEGYEPIVLDDLSSGVRERVRTGVPFVEADVRDADSMVRAVADFRPEAVVHLAARVFDTDERHIAVSDLEVNVAGALQVAAAAAAANVPHVVFASSAAVYGELIDPIADEDHATRPQSPNGIAKLAVEGFLRTILGDAIPSVTVLRFANLYGTGSSIGSGSAVHAFVECLANGEPPLIEGDGNQTRDFVYVRDAARAVASTITARPSGVFNVGTGVETTIRGLASDIAGALGVPSTAPKFAPSRRNDVRRSCLDSTRLFHATGFRPATRLEQGLAVTLASHRATILQD